jgi:hypothetical protein
MISTRDARLFLGMTVLGLMACSKIDKTWLFVNVESATPIPAIVAECGDSAG